MPEFQILCACVHQDGFDKVREMNLRCDAVFANQGERYAYCEETLHGHRIRMLTTATKGVGINRNLGLLLADAEILLFSDEDMVYDDGLKERVLRAFRELPKADVIIFGLRFSENGKVTHTRRVKTGRLPIYRSMRYGAVSMAVRRSAILRKNIHFSTLFGGGSRYCHGEDSDFLLQCYRKGLNIYCYDAILGTTARDASSWFRGYDERFFYDTGALGRHSFGIFGPAYLVYMALRIRDHRLNLRSKLDYLWAGYRNFPRLLSYQDWMEERT